MKKTLLALATVCLALTANAQEADRFVNRQHVKFLLVETHVTTTYIAIRKMSKAMTPRLSVSVS